MEENTPETNTNAATTTRDDLNDDQEYDELNTSPQTAKPRKKRSRRTAHTKNQPSLDSFARKAAVKANDAATQANADALAAPSLEEDLNLGRRKRRKTSSPEPPDVAANGGQSASESSSNLYQQLHAEAGLVGTQDVIDDLTVGDTLVVSTPKDNALVSLLPPVTEDTQQDTVPESSLPQASENVSRSVTPPHAGQTAVIGNETPPPESVDGTSVKLTPKKHIKVTKTGKLVSSPSKPATPASTTPKKRGRPRKAAKGPTFPQPSRSSDMAQTANQGQQSDKRSRISSVAASQHSSQFRSSRPSLLGHRRPPIHSSWANLPRGK